MLPTGFLVDLTNAGCYCGNRSPDQPGIRTFSKGLFCNPLKKIDCKLRYLFARPSKVWRVTEKSFNRQPFLAATGQVSKFSDVFNSRCENAPLYSQAVRME
jgi:hypothetical protein